MTPCVSPWVSECGGEVEWEWTGPSALRYGGRAEMPMLRWTGATIAVLLTLLVA